MAIFSADAGLLGKVYEIRPAEVFLCFSASFLVPAAAVDVKNFILFLRIGLIKGEIYGQSF